ncbi:MAG: rhodanese-like domain-containing protein [Rubrivivax sp.]
MNFLIDNWVLLLVAFVSGAMLVWPMVRGGGSAGSVGPAEAVRLMNREKAVVLDIREAAEYAGGHIVGARNVALAQIEAAKDLPTNKALPLVVVCATGARAGRAVSALRRHGYVGAVGLAGGLAAWREAGLPTEKS